MSYQDPVRLNPITKKILFISSLFLLITILGVVVRNFTPVWKNYQKQYFQKAIQKATEDTVKEALAKRTPRIEQIMITDFGEPIVDRCLSCHMAIDDDRFKNEPQPFTTHPELKGEHKFRQMGCTVCHDGNGRGLTVEDAHGQMKHWQKPLLPNKYLESSCAKCHPDPFLDETPNLQMGRQLYMNKACYACHKVEGVSDGTLGVELTEVGRKWNISYIVESIVDPRANNQESIMPKLDLNEKELHALVVYLKSLDGQDYKHGPIAKYEQIKMWKQRPLPKVPVSLASGRNVFEQKSCSACHTVNGEGGKIGPDLSVVALQRPKEWLIKHQVNPRLLVAGSIMPILKYSPTELEALMLYLTSLSQATSE